MRHALILLLLIISFASCGDYQKVLNKGDTAQKYAYADSLYRIGKYKRALKLMEQIVPAYRGRPQAERLMYIYADSYYKLGDYFLSGYQFERFAQAYPQSDSAEVAFFRSAESFYNISEPYSLDQRETYRAMEKLQSFINTYNDSEMRDEANRMVVELRTKLEKKELEVLKQYYRMEYYNAAIAAADNFISDNPGSVYREEVFLIRLKAAYDYALRSIPSLVEERLNSAQKHYENYSKYFQNGDFSKEANAINSDINKRLASYKTESTI